MISQAAYTVLFYLLAAVSVALASAAVGSRMLLRAAVYLMGLLLTGAGLYVMLGAPFLAGIQVLVYVGGLVVLIVFAVMLTRSAELLTDVSSVWRRLLAGAASLMLLGLMLRAFSTSPLPAPPARAVAMNPPAGASALKPPDGAPARKPPLSSGGVSGTALTSAPAGAKAPPADPTAAIGLKLLDRSAAGYVLPFEIVSLLLLAAVIGGIVVARKVPPPGQPFTSGGDLPGEADFLLPHNQRDTPTEREGQEP